VTVVLCLKVDSLSTEFTISYNDNTQILTALASQVALLTTCSVYNIIIIIVIITGSTTHYLLSL